MILGDLEEQWVLLLSGALQALWRLYRAPWQRPDDPPHSRESEASRAPL